MAKAEIFFTSLFKRVIIIIFVVLFVVFSFYFLCLNHVGVNQLGVAYDPIGGQIAKQKVPGWYITGPFVRVAYIDILPIRVTIPSAAKVINTRLVRFRAEGLDEYIKLQGFGYDLTTSLENILMGYAFSGREYPFLEIMEEPTEPRK
jgi:hypothetical protein